MIWKNSSKAQEESFPFGIYYDERHINIWGNCSIATQKIGQFVEIGGTNEHPTYIGKDTIISAFAFICPGTIIGDNVFIGPRFTSTNDRHPPSKLRNGHTQDWKGCIIEDDVVIGASVTLLPGVKLGKGCRIGAGSIVTKDVPPGSLWIGTKLQ